MAVMARMIFASRDRIWPAKADAASVQRDSSPASPLPLPARSSKKPLVISGLSARWHWKTIMSDKQKKPQKLKARLPRGFVDRSAADIHATNEMTAKIREVYERYGFDPVETPLF